MTLKRDVCELVPQDLRQLMRAGPLRHIARDDDDAELRHRDACAPLRRAPAGQRVEALRIGREVDGDLIALLEHTGRQTREYESALGREQGLGEPLLTRPVADEDITALRRLLLRSAGSRAQHDRGRNAERERQSGLHSVRARARRTASRAMPSAIAVREST